MTDQLALFDAPDDEPPARPRAPAPAAVDDATHAVAARLPAGVRLGTSSWAFPGWRGLLWRDVETETRLARDGLDAYARHPLFRAVGIDRSFYGPLDAATFRGYAAQVPDAFRFVVKAPAAVTDAVLRGERGRATGDNPRFLDPGFAIDHALAPAVEGLGDRLGALVLQLSPLPRPLLERAPMLLERLARCLGAMRDAAPGAVIAVEVRDGELVSPRLATVLAASGARYCHGVHARMPKLALQAAAMATLPRGPFVARWNLHAGYAYEEAKAHYAPFDRLVDPDPQTRSALARLVHDALARGDEALVTINNKAEGSAPRSVMALAAAIAADLPATA